MKVSILSHDLSDANVVRVYALSLAIRRYYDVEVIGPVLGQGVWEPSPEFAYKAVTAGNTVAFCASIRRLLSCIEGDVVYASKPLLTSAGVALLRKLATRCPVIVDVDDWPYGVWLREWQLSPRVAWLRTKGLLRLWDPLAFPYAALTAPLLRYADDITVTSTFLQRHFSGTIVPQFQDTDLFDPARFDGGALKQEWGLHDQKVIMFCGTPYPHKGIEDLVQAITCLRGHDSVRLVLKCANKNQPYVQRLLASGQERVICLAGHRPMQEIPMFLAMADLIVLPQRDTPISAAQIPMKLIDAMAMAKPIIATDVSDLAMVLEGCGLIVEPGDIRGLSEKISYLLDNEDVARALGHKARQKCLEQYSLDVQAPRLASILSRHERR